MTIADYSNAEENNLRWLDFEFRAGDIVISTRSKHGTTWVQMICALLVHGTPGLPAPLGQLSPWLDRRTESQADIFDRLASQRHRRIIKTHTPLDGVVIDERATYLVVARHPLDAAVSLWHQSGNLDHRRIDELTGEEHRPRSRPPLGEWLRGWIASNAAPTEALDSLKGVLWHLTGAWQRRKQPNVVLVHYDDLITDLPGEIHRLGELLDAPVEPDVFGSIVDAASFDAMRAHAPQVAPDPDGVLVDPQAFFRQGGTSEAWDILGEGDLARYRERVDDLAPADLVDWLHRTR